MSEEAEAMDNLYTALVQCFGIILIGKALDCYRKNLTNYKLVNYY